MFLKSPLKTLGHI